MVGYVCQCDAFHNPVYSDGVSDVCYDTILLQMVYPVDSNFEVANPKKKNYKQINVVRMATS